MAENGNGTPLRMKPNAIYIFLLSLSPVTIIAASIFVGGRFQIIEQHNIDIEGLKIVATQLQASQSQSIAETAGLRRDIDRLINRVDSMNDMRRP